jgi:D-lyxose ketol-isomerase
MSITLLPGQYHEFWAEPGSGKVLLGEISSVNDDNTDNRFYEPLGRFPEIEEDEPRFFCFATSTGFLPGNSKLLRTA